MVLLMQFDRGQARANPQRLSARVLCAARRGNHGAAPGVGLPRLSGRRSGARLRRPPANHIRAAVSFDRRANVCVCVLAECTDNTQRGRVLAGHGEGRLFVDGGNERSPRSLRIVRACQLSECVVDALLDHPPAPVARLSSLFDWFCRVGRVPRAPHGPCARASAPDGQRG